ncbi:MAG TPA: 3-phosphoserine/phosphohydroxythreonine transaminase [Steroidobacteraceae bacterium]
MRVFNFAPGPAALPLPVLEQAQAELLDWRGSGMSVMEVSHRGKAFLALAAQAEADLRELLSIPANYKVLFLQGGAAGQFAAIPLNLTTAESVVDYVNTGSWSKKALGEARRYCRVNVAADAQASRYTSVPAQSEWRVTNGAAYLHYTPNETIGGVEYPFIPTSDAPLVADMSSTILSRPLDVSRFGLIYAGAQKNIGPSGLVIVIVREDLLGRARPDTPLVWNYTSMAADGSMSNTPPTFAWYVAGLTFQWLKREGGLQAMAERNRAKAQLLYRTIDESGFYRNPVDKPCRSWMNVPFILPNEQLDKLFLTESAAAGLANLAGHRSVGGMRASIYNAMPLEGVQALVDFMGDFARRHG